MNGATSKRCGCRNPATGKPFGAKCPRLRRGRGWNPHHGVWQYQIELPRSADGRRRPLRRGSYDSQADAEVALRTINDALAVPDPGDTDDLTRVGDLIEVALGKEQPIPTVEQLRRLLRAVDRPDTIPTVAAQLTQFMTARTKKLKPGTARSYQGHIDNHLVPHLGAIRADKLRVGHIDGMYDDIEERNERIHLFRACGDHAKREQVKGLRVVGPATMHRIRATLRAAYNWGIRRGMVDLNPAKHVELPAADSPRALVWTEERIAEWQRTGAVPSPVMVWTPAQTGAFLDHVQAVEDRLYALYHLVAYRGLRRGEACGLHRAEFDAANKKITIAWQIAQHGWAAALERPKTDSSHDDVAHDDATVTALTTHLTRQRRERLHAGERWVENGLIFTTPIGEALHPAHVTDHFQLLAQQAGLPPIRLHDLRHGAATIALAAGIDMKIVQAMLRHSSITVTSDLYTSVLPDLAYNAAEKAAAAVPRRRHLKAVS